MAVAVQKSSSPSSAIMKGEITNSLKPPLTKRPFEVCFWKLNDIPGSGGCLRQKEQID